MFVIAKSKVQRTLKLQADIDRLGSRARKWGMRFQPVKCNIMQITRKRIKKFNASYNLKGTVLDNVENIKYLGITITNDLKWNTHISNICTKANRTLGFLRCNLSACPQDVKESACKGLVSVLFGAEIRPHSQRKKVSFIPNWWEKIPNLEILKNSDCFVLKRNFENWTFS